MVKTEKASREHLEAINCCTYSVSSIYASYGAKRSNILENFSFDFIGGNVYVIMGPNGCGKSTLLRILAGEISPDSGTLSFRCDNVRHKKTIEYIPQDYRQALFPWKTTRENVWPWQNVRTPDNGSIDRALERFGLGQFHGKYPHELSGGQQQIILLSRSVVAPDQILLLDEPFSALDVVRRAYISEYLRQQWQPESKTVICAMHEPEEAVLLADVILVFHGPPLNLVGVVSRSDSGSSLETFRENVEALIREVAKEETNVDT